MHRTLTGSRSEPLPIATRCAGGSTRQRSHFGQLAASWCWCSSKAAMVPRSITRRRYHRDRLTGRA